MADPHARRARLAYALTVVVGLAAAALTSVAGSRTWATGQASAAGMHVDATVPGSQAAPLVAALGLVALAGWGVVLVTRGRVRRAVAVIGLAASVGAFAAAVRGLTTVAGAVTSSLLDQGAGQGRLSSDTTGWPFLALAMALVAAAAFLVAVLRMPRWPEMGSKYDAPAARADTESRESDMWRALDEGRDPTS
ncbi:MAG TPA: Trp biosynthesis-associated membrane protein [Nocardioidaceae bacterium]|nr:Trp biosynthesis-associated membrane protein [Nocardioidaceae bacterium]